MSKVKIPGWPEALTPQMPGIAAESGMDHPFAGGFDFVKNLWAGVPGATPGFVVPTFDVAEIDKRIKDLNAALTWLEMNVHMLKASIQGLEVQRNTIAALQAISGSLGQMTNNAAEFFKAGTTPAGPDSTVAPADGSIAPDWPNFTGASQQKPADQAWGAPAPEPAKECEAETQKSSNTATQARAAATMAAPTNMWLDFLQDQFNKIACAAVATSAAPSTASAASSTSHSAAATAPHHVEERAPRSAAAARAAKSGRAAVKAVSRAPAPRRKKPAS